MLTSLAQGNLLIYNDIAWQYLAYLDGGINELSRAHKAGELSDELFAAWQNIDNGKKGLLQAKSAEQKVAAQDLIWQGNVALVVHEQAVVLPPMYEPNRELWAMFSGGIQSPIPGDEWNFFGGSTFLMGRNIADTDERLAWILKTMLPAWNRVLDNNPERVFVDMEEYRRRPIAQPVFAGLDLLNLNEVIRVRRPDPEE